MTNQFRQGDVLLIQVDKIPTGLKSRQDAKTILAFGEVSGHHHRFESGNVLSFYKEGDDSPQISGGSLMLRGSRTDVEFVSLTETTPLVHEEHTAIPVEPGNYRVVRQREFSVLDGIRRVAD